MSILEKLEEYPVRVEIPVAWGEMDSLGHVNNIVYFRYFETARMEYFGRIGVMEVMQEVCRFFSYFILFCYIIFMPHALPIARVWPGARAGGLRPRRAGHSHRDQLPWGDGAG